DLLYYGRNDDQMKIRGFRIDPAEIDANLAAHPDLRAAAATWYPTRVDSRSIVAAVLAKPGRDVSEAALRDWIASRLPAHMIPARFLFLDAMPLKPSGKVDRGAIRDLAVLSSAPVDVGPRAATETEAALMAIWRRVLGRIAV